MPSLYFSMGKNNMKSNCAKTIISQDVHNFRFYFIGYVRLGQPIMLVVGSEG